MICSIGWQVVAMLLDVEEVEEVEEVDKVKVRKTK